MITKKELRHRIASLRADEREYVSFARKRIREGDYHDAIGGLARAEYALGCREALERVLGEMGDE